MEPLQGCVGIFGHLILDSVDLVVLSCCNLWTCLQGACGLNVFGSVFDLDSASVRFRGLESLGLNPKQLVRLNCESLLP